MILRELLDIKKSKTNPIPDLAPRQEPDN